MQILIKNAIKETRVGETPTKDSAYFGIEKFENFENQVSHIILRGFSFFSQIFVFCVINAAKPAFSNIETRIKIVSIIVQSCLILDMGKR